MDSQSDVHYYVKRNCFWALLSFLNLAHVLNCTISVTSVLILSTRLSLGFQSGLFPEAFLDRISFVFLISPVHGTHYTHLMLLDLINLVVFDEEDAL
jgi:hypothetical protein